MINLRDDILKNQIAYYNGLIAKQQRLRAASLLSLQAGCRMHYGRR